MIQTMKKLLSGLFTGKKLIMSFITMVLLLGVVSFLSYELTKTPVTIIANGEETSIQTHAKTVDQLLVENDILVGEYDFIEPSLDTVLEKEMEIVWKPALRVNIERDDEQTYVWTTSATVGDLVKELGLEIADVDKIHPSLETEITEGINITYESAFVVTLNSDGEEREVWTTSTTVADFLEKEELILGELDRVEPAQEEFVTPNAQVNVVRVEKVTDVVEETQSYATVTRKDSSVLKGNERVIESGQEGKVAKYYEVILENGKEVSRELVKTETVQESKDRVVAVGTKEVVQISRGNSSGDWTTFESTAYTAYCSGCSGTTSTGLDLRSNPNQRVVAVDPRVIPLGSKIEIKGMGTYTAADIGGAIKGRKIDIFMPSRSDALAWGRRNIQLRIIE